MLLKVSQSVCFTSNNESNDASKPDVKCADGSNLGQVYYYFSKKSDLIESNSGMEDLDVSLNKISILSRILIKILEFRSKNPKDVSFWYLPKSKIEFMVFLQLLFSCYWQNLFASMLHPISHLFLFLIQNGVQDI